MAFVPVPSVMAVDPLDQGSAESGYVMPVGEDVELDKVVEISVALVLYRNVARGQPSDEKTKGSEAHSFNLGEAFCCLGEASMEGALVVWREVTQ